MNKLKKITIGTSLIIFLITLFSIKFAPEAKINKDIQVQPTQTSKTIELPSQTNRQDGISFQVRPLDFSFDEPIKFEIKIDTHSDSLNFDLTQISILEDDKGNKYQPLDWQGSPPGGHHRSGILIFPNINSKTKKINLIIQDVSPRFFEWDLK